MILVFSVAWNKSRNFLACISRQNTTSSALHVLNLHLRTKMKDFFKSHEAEVVMQQIRNRATQWLVTDELL